MDAGRSPRDINLFLAKIAEEVERYDDKLDFLEKVAAEEDELNQEERSLFSRSFLKATLPRQRAWLIFNIAEKKCENNNNDADLIAGIKVYKEKIASELSSAADRFLALLDSKIIPSAITDGEKALYLAAKGDFNSSLADVRTGQARNFAIDQALEAYNTSMSIAKEKLRPSDPQRLTISLSYAIFHFGTLDLPEMALKITRTAYDEARKDKPYEAVTREDTEQLLIRLLDFIIRAE